MSEPQPPVTSSGLWLDYAIAIVLLLSAALALWPWFGLLMADVARVLSTSGGPMSLAGW